MTASPGASGRAPATSAGGEVFAFPGIGAPTTASGAGKRVSQVDGLWLVKPGHVLSGVVAVGPVRALPAGGGALLGTVGAMLLSDGETGGCGVCRSTTGGASVVVGAERVVGRSPGGCGSGGCGVCGSATGSVGVAVGAERERDNSPGASGPGGCAAGGSGVMGTTPSTVARIAGGARAGSVGGAVNVLGVGGGRSRRPRACAADARRANSAKIRNTSAPSPTLRSNSKRAALRLAPASRRPGTVITEGDPATHPIEEGGYPNRPLRNHPEPRR